MSALRNQLVLNRLCAADWHREDRTVKGPIGIAVFHCERIDLAAEQAQKAAAAVWGSHADGTDSLSNGLLAVTSADDVFNRARTYVGCSIAVSEV
jgi:hypothetical protein